MNLGSIANNYVQASEKRLLEYKQGIVDQFEVVGGLYLKNLAVSTILNGGNIMSGYRPREWGSSVSSAIQAVFIRSNIGGLFFDAIMKTDTETSLTATSHPTQLGANISDHAYVNPTHITMDIMMSDAMASFIPGMYGESSFTGTKSVNAYKTLVKMQKLRIPLRVVTRYDTYQNMLIKSITSPDDASTRYGLRATVELEEIFVINVASEKVSARDWTTASQKATAEIQTKTNNRTIAREIELGLGVGK